MPLQHVAVSFLQMDYLLDDPALPISDFVKAAQARNEEHHG